MSRLNSTGYLLVSGIESEHTEGEWERILNTALKENEEMALPIDVFKVIEPRHDKTNKMSVRPLKTQNSLGICPV